MKACFLLRHWCFGLLLIPCISFGQSDYHPASYPLGDQNNNISSNVPLNEISSRAFRNFHHIFHSVTQGEYWFCSQEGYQVSFTVNGVYYQAFFDPRGGYRYSLHHYAGKEIPREPGDQIKRKYPDYQLNVVTEITDGDKIVYLVRLVGLTSIKTVSLCDGELQLIGEQPIYDPSATAELTSRRSYP